MDKVKIVTVSHGKDVKEKSFISINGKELKTCTNYKIEKKYNENGKVIIYKHNKPRYIITSFNNKNEIDKDNK